MAVGRISGPLLATNLERNGINLNVKNTLSDTSLLHLDATALKLGFNTDVTTDEVQVLGMSKMPNMIASTQLKTGNLILGNGSNINSLDSPIVLQAAVGGTINLSGLATDQIEINDNSIKSYNTNSNIDIRTGTPYELVSGDPYMDELIAGLQAASGGGSHAYKAFWEVVLPSGFQRGDINESGGIDIDDVLGFLGVARGTTTSGGRYDRGIAAILASLPTTEIPTNLRVFGNLHSAQKITADGNITIGSGDEDNLILNAELTTDIMPDANDTYDLGKAGKEWGEIHTNLVNGQAVDAAGVLATTTNFGLRQGNIFYVSKNGNDSNEGDNVQGPMLTVKAALARADASIQGPVEIHIFPGEYEEVFPLEIPTNVSVVGHNMRSVIIKPTAGTNTNNCFLMNGETTVQHVTVKDFFSPGHAFSFASNTVVTSRSPYVQNVSVITAGSVTSVSDPRGFAQGDAGKGALVDGANVLSASQEASMLFHSVTFITPGVDAITMTNGVRVEWLNSFTYFANRGLYAVRGVTGHLSTDGSTTQFGAEIRSIGSANVYGNYGAVADGVGTIMYLIQHNFGYIGSGKFLDNDPSRAIQAQEISELNSGNIYFSSTDHLGNFRVGDQFFVDLESGSTSIVITEAQVNALNGINVTTGGSTSILNGAQASTGNLIITNNTLFSSPGSINVDSAAGIVNFLDNTNVTGNVTMSGDFTIGGSVIGFGNDANDTINFAQEFDQNIVPDISGAYSLGLASKTWKKAWLSAVQSDDVLIQDNFITTTETNNDLEFRAQGTGSVLLEDIAVDENKLFTKADDLNFTTNTNFNIATTGSIKLPAGTDGQRINADSTGAPGIGSIRYSTDSNRFEGQTINAPITFNGVFSSDRLTSVTADPTSNNIRFIINGAVDAIDSSTLMADITGDKILFGALSVDDIKLDGNTISTEVSNSNLQFAMHGGGKFVQKDLKIKNNILEITDGGPMTFVTDDGYFAFRGSSGIVMPSGGNDTRGPNPQTGDTRFNARADVKALEVYAGVDNKEGVFQEWIPATGAGESVTIEYQEDQVNIWSIVLG
jgi:hypothetical protein